jgi:hypothetical protein
MGGRTDDLVGERLDGARTVGWVGGRMYERKDGCAQEWQGGRMDGWADGWMGGRSDGWTGRWVGIRMDVFAD